MFPRRVRIGASVGLFAVVSVHGAFAQELLLQIRPRAGDTLRMRLDQETDYTGAGVTRTGVGPASLVTTMAMFSRAIVEGEANEETAVLAVTDSVRFWSTDQRGSARLDRWRLACGVNGCASASRPKGCWPWRRPAHRARSRTSCH